MSLLSNMRRWIGPADAGDRIAAAEGAPSSSLFPAAGEDAALRTVRPRVLRVILGVAMRDVQLRAGLDTEALDFEIVDCAGSRPGTRGLRAQFVLKVRDPHVLASLAQLERLLVARLGEIDADAQRWFRGVSWRLDLPSARGPDAATRH